MSNIYLSKCFDGTHTMRPEEWEKMTTELEIRNSLKLQFIEYQLFLKYQKGTGRKEPPKTEIKTVE